MGWEEGPFFTFPRNKLALRNVETIKDAPFPISAASIPREESSCSPPSPQTPTCQSGQGSRAWPPAPLASRKAHQCWGASAGGRCGLHAPASDGLKHRGSGEFPGGTTTLHLPLLKASYYLHLPGQPLGAGKAHLLARASEFSRKTEGCSGKRKRPGLQ